ncbi:Spo0B domain-containing protein [Cohnella thermotolerans]|uniref:Spo0B domain-containing protein n=1 Tax=Cohnella thermotolerans TaxID=329858 RepID=UPI00068472B3|nr:Spo0B domain-containing protein [Cohnella thermotolerans]
MSRKSIARAIVAAGSLLVPAAAMIGWRQEWWPPMLFALWTAAAAVLVVVAELRSERRRYARLLELMQHSAVETLSHHRHDWMNELQILYGYLRLGKPDKAIAVVERIRGRMEQDSRISHLGEPKLAAFLLSFRTTCDTMRLEVEVEDGFNVKGMGLDGERLTSAVIGLVNVVRFRLAAQGEEENVLWLRFHSEEGEARLDMAYAGKVAAADDLASELERVLGGYGRVSEESGAVREDGASRCFAVVFPRMDRPCN